MKVVAIVYLFAKLPSVSPLAIENCTARDLKITLLHSASHGVLDLVALTCLISWMRGVPCSFYLRSTYALTFTSQSRDCYNHQYYRQIIITYSISNRHPWFSRILPYALIRVQSWYEVVLAGTVWQLLTVSARAIQVAELEFVVYLYIFNQSDMTQKHQPKLMQFQNSWQVPHGFRYISLLYGPLFFLIGSLLGHHFLYPLLSHCITIKLLFFAPILVIPLTRHTAW